MPNDPTPSAPSGDWRAALGPLQPLFEDAEVSEIMVNGPERIFVERQGLLTRFAGRFESTAALEAVVGRLASAANRVIDARNPYVDGSLPDGSRMNAVVAPVAVGGPAVTIRKFRPNALSGADLTRLGAWDARIATFLEACVKGRVSMLISGGTGSGKTTVLNVLGASIPTGERLVTIEDTVELRLTHENWARLESRPATPTDPGVSTRALVVNALRMRPDRILVGECRSAEAFDMLIAMNTGHDGSMTTVHANSAREALQRLESMVLMAGTDMPIKVIRQYVARAIQVVVHTQRGADGKRRVSEVIELGGMEGDVLLTQGIFQWVPGQGFQAARTVPQVTKLLRDRNVPLPSDLFSETYKPRVAGGDTAIRRK